MTVFGLVCALCVGMMVLVVTVTFYTGFFCNNRKYGSSPLEERLHRLPREITGRLLIDY